MRPDFFYLLIYGRASPKILGPPEKWNCHFGFYYFLFVDPSYFWGKIYQFYLYFWLFCLYNFIFMLSPRLMKFQDIPVNQSIKKCWPEISFGILLHCTNYCGCESENSKFTRLVEKFEWATIQCKIIKAELFSTSPYTPCLTLWDKISHLEAKSHKIIKSHRIFRPSYTTFYEEITYNVNHTLLFLSQDSYI